MRRVGWMSALLLLYLLVSPLWAATYKVDPHHTTVGFKIRHLFSWVHGTFNEFEGTIEYEPAKPESWSASGTIQAASIDTRVAPRDKHLRSGDFFDVEKYPTIDFRTTRIDDVGANKAKLHGFLTIHGVEKEVELDVEVLGIANDPWGNTVAGFSATTTFDRRDFGLTWNETLETGSVLVGNEVQITLDISALLQK